jgi:hypothetical protein
MTISDFDRTRLPVLREQLHQEYLARYGKAAATPSTRQTGGEVAA